MAKHAVTLTIPSQYTDRIVTLMAGLRDLFPSRADELRAIFRQAERGIQCTVEPLKLDQTDQQRGYYWMWLRNFANFCGATPDETHEHILCEAFGASYHRTMLGLMKRPIQRSSESKREDYSHLIETLIRVAAEMGFIIPPSERG